MSAGPAPSAYRRAQLQLFWIETRNVATSRQMGGFILGLMLPLFLIIMVAMGCMFPAIDCTAGEREKSTWETTMTIATPRANIVAAKYLYVATMAALAGILNLAAMLLSMKSIMAPLIGGRTDSLSFQIPLLSIPVILAGDDPPGPLCRGGHDDSRLFCANLQRGAIDGESVLYRGFSADPVPAGSGN